MTRLSDAEREALGPFIWGGWIGVAEGREAEFSRDLHATVERIVADRVAGIERERDEWIAEAESNAAAANAQAQHARTHWLRAERAEAKVAALTDGNPDA